MLLLTYFVSCFEIGIVTWDHNRPHMALVQLSGFKDHFSILDSANETLICPKIATFNVYECYETLKTESPNFEGCKIHLRNAVPNKSEMVKVNSLTFQRQKSSEEFNPCLAKDSWDDKNILKKIMDWKNTLLDIRSHQWYQKPRETPLSLQNPRIKILLSSFIKRIGFFNSRFRIMSRNGSPLLSGFMINGLISENVPSEIAMLDDWKFPVSILIYNTLEVVNVMVEQDQNPSFIVSGQLFLGQLDGLVVMDGVVSNSPNDHCSNLAFKGLGLVGQFKNGIPHGKVWKQLHGGSWIYGEVDKNGDMTGKKFLFDKTTKIILVS
jgi:hypothetical protein